VGVYWLIDGCFLCPGGVVWLLSLGCRSSCACKKGSMGNGHREFCLFRKSLRPGIQRMDGAYSSHNFAVFGPENQRKQMGLLLVLSGPFDGHLGAKMGRVVHIRSVVREIMGLLEKNSTGRAPASKTSGWVPQEDQAREVLGPCGILSPRSDERKKEEGGNAAVEHIWKDQGARSH